VSTAPPDGWDELVGTLEPHVSPEWTRQARAHGGQPWVRLIAMVDAHAQLATPRLEEKIGETMAELAVERPAEQEGWRLIAERAKDRRLEIVASLVDAAPRMLGPEHLPLFVRSVDPTGVM
jgi:hypothetical protein